MTIEPPPGRIHDDNRRLHDADGYAEHYAAHCGFLNRPHLAARFEAAVGEAIARWRASQHDGTPLDGTPTALDVGAGTGNLTRHLLAGGATVTAVDLSSAMLDRLRERHVNALQVGRLTLLASTIEDALARLPDARWDVITAASVLHHLPDYAAVTRELAQRLSSGGVLLVMHEPVPPTWRSWGDRLTLAIEDRWRRLRQRLPKSWSWSESAEPGWSGDCLADYWTGSRGVDLFALAAEFVEQGFDASATRYTACRYRPLEAIGARVGKGHLQQLVVQRVDQRPTPPTDVA